MDAMYAIPNTLGSLGLIRLLRSKKKVLSEL